MRWAMASTEPSIFEWLTESAFSFSLCPWWPWPLPRACGASPPVAPEPMFSSGGGAGGMAATIDLSTASARARAPTAQVVTRAAPLRAGDQNRAPDRGCRGRRAQAGPHRAVGRRGIAVAVAAVGSADAARSGGARPPEGRADVAEAQRGGQRRVYR